MCEQYTVLEKHREHNYFLAGHAMSRKRVIEVSSAAEDRICQNTPSPGVVERREREQIFSEKERCVWGST